MPTAMKTFRRFLQLLLRHNLVDLRFVKSKKFAAVLFELYRIASVNTMSYQCAVFNIRRSVKNNQFIIKKKFSKLVFYRWLLALSLGLLTSCL